MEGSREKAQVTEHHIENTAYTKYPGNYFGISDEWNLEQFRKNFKVKIINYYMGRDLELDMIGIGPAIANAYRRIMIAEVPTMAIEYCFIYNNTSVIQDEMLSHRVGMIPIRVDPTRFKWRPSDAPKDSSSPEFAIVFSLKAKCEELPNSQSDRLSRREDTHKDYKVYSEHIKWEPGKGMLELFPEDQAPRPVHKKILLAKLSGKQEIKLKLYASKGIGRDHAKFSPVATASYRLLPCIELLEDISGEQAERLKECFSEGVIKLVGSKRVAKVADARIDSGSRNVFRYPDLKDKVKYELIKDHFIFKVESSGCMPAMDIAIQACHILESKCDYFLEELKARRSSVNEFAPVVEGI